METHALQRKEKNVSPNEKYYFELLTDVRSLLNMHAHDDKKLRQQLEFLLNRKSPDDKQPFAKNGQLVG